MIKDSFTVIAWEVFITNKQKKSVHFLGWMLWTEGIMKFKHCRAVLPEQKWLKNKYKPLIDVGCL